MNKEELKDAIGGLGDFINLSTDDAAESVTRELELKYGCKFKVEKVGGRIDSGAVAFYLSPEDNSDIVFKATIDTDSGNISENYIQKIIAAEFEKKFESNLKKYGITGASSASFTRQDDSNEDDIEITVSEYFEKYQVNSAFIYLALDNSTLTSDSAGDLIEACRTTGDDLGVIIAVNGVVLSDKYSACADDMKKEPKVSATWFDAYSPLCNYHFAVSGGESNITEEELKKILAGD